MQLIAKNTGMSIGIFLTFCVFVFYGGERIGNYNARLDIHEGLQTHKGTSELFVPRSEVELQFKAMRSDIEEIKETQQLILLELRK